jgi:DNA-binding response OmpR family regulator
MRVLLVEDEAELAGAVSAALHRGAIVVDHVTRLEDAISAAASNPYDVVVLDRTLPDGDGLSIIRPLRAAGYKLPILILSARDALDDRVGGLDHGADDYLTKPFEMEELLARLRALHRRGPNLPREILQVGNLQFDFANKEVLIHGRPVLLPRRELLLLDAMLRRFGRTVLRSAVEDALYSFDDDIQSNALDAHMSRLRKKLAELDAGVEIHTIRGVGYLIKAIP